MARLATAGRDELVPALVAGRGIAGRADLVLAPTAGLRDDREHGR
jgi:hypothetical protein